MPPFPRTRRTLQVLITIWSLAWVAIVAVFAAGEEGGDSLLPAMRFVVPLLAIAIATWWRPTIGGALAIAGGIFAMLYFDHTFPRTWLATPAILLGAMTLRTSFRRPFHPIEILAWVALLLGLVACSTFTPQRDRDLPYRSGTIERLEDGSMRKGRLVEPTVIDERLCEDWVHFHPDGTIRGCKIAEDTTVQGHPLPAETLMWFTPAGRLQNCWLAKDTAIESVLCRGGAKISTGFHPNGRLRSAFLRQDAVVRGVPCAASLFAPVRFHPDGSVAGCKLSREYSRDGQTFPAGSEPRFAPR